MTMNRSLAILLGLLALGIVVFGAAFWTSRMTCRMTASTDELTWLQSEYHLNEAQMAQMRQLHEGYRPKCAEFCAKIAVQKELL